MKIVITDAMTVTQGDIDLSLFSEFGEIITYDNTKPEETAERVKEADIVLCNKTVLGKNELEGAKNLKLICLFATGYNNIDVVYCKENGITVCNAGSYSTHAVAQHTFALILEHYSKVGSYAKFVENGGWCDSPMFSPFVYPTDELYGKTIGIIGYGAIGMQSAKLALAFGMKVLVYTRTPKNDPNVTFTDFDTLLKESDIISVHCPLTAATERMFTYEEFKKCKPSCLFINTARGAITDEADLQKALNDGLISGAGIDVLTLEPMRKTCSLSPSEKLIMTPHIAWAPLATRIRLMGIVSDNIRSFLAGTPKNVVSN